ncbi:hypothetical protein [Halorubrum aethiopicum]|uniref:hypothetical protein n=1 Tax=Halorubrum aethiopicum TaxID=1758255 RepID=UPI0012FEA48B|nr:hypothetical protein [Halorubrum aethiopicum]
MRFDETEPAVTRRVFRCDGHRYENELAYDLRDDGDRLAFERKLDTFIEWFEDAQERSDGRVYVEDEAGHWVFRRGHTLIACNVEEVSKRDRRIYFSVDVLDSA